MLATAAHPSRRSPAEVAALAVGTLTVSAAGAVAYAFDPSRPSALMPKCILNATTGLFCPGCGATRSVHSLLHGNVAGAFSYNPLFFLLLPFFVWLGLRYAAGVVWPQHRLSLDIRLSPRIAFAIPAVLIGYAVLRNIPIEPFSWLAPPAV